MTRADNTGPRPCGAVDDIDYGVWFECELSPGHPGDHQGIHYWENQPHGPALPPRAATGRVWLSDACQQMAAQQIEFVLRGSPLVNREKAMRVEPMGRTFQPVRLDPEAMARLADGEGFQAPAG